MSNRGIKIFRVPGDYNTLGEVTSNGHPQFRDIVIVRPTSYNDKMHIYQYLYDVNEALYLKEIKDYQWEDLSNDINVTFTDNVIIPNVTPIRKAHQEDYRNMLMFLKNVSANKYGDFYEGLFDQTLAKHQWNNGTYASEMFLSADNNTFYFNISEETLLNISKIDTDFNVISPLFILGAENLEVYVDTQINAELDVIGETTLHSDVHLNSEGGSTLIEGKTRINNNLIVIGNETLNGSLSVGEDVAAHKLSGSILNVISSSHTNVITDLNADKLDGWDLNPGNSFGCIPKIDNYGVMEIGKYLDFHNTSTETGDFNIRLMVDAPGKYLYLVKKDSNNFGRVLTSMDPGAIVWSGMVADGAEVHLSDDNTVHNTIVFISIIGNGIPSGWGEEDDKVFAGGDHNASLTKYAITQNAQIVNDSTWKINCNMVCRYGWAKGGMVGTQTFHKAANILIVRI